MGKDYLRWLKMFDGFLGRPTQHGRVKVPPTVRVFGGGQTKCLRFLSRLFCQKHEYATIFFGVTLYL